MSEFLVSSSAQLLSAIASAKSGDVIKLASGTYSDIGLLDVKFSGGVTITSANKDVPAELTGLRLNKVEGLTFTNLVMTDKTPSTLYDFRVSNSKDITFDNVLIQGSDGNGPYTSAPFMIRGSSDITVSNSEVRHARYGISMLDNDGVTLTNNKFHDLRTDGIRGGGNSNVLIEGNNFTNFHPEENDHPDAIQFWTTGTTKSAENITIRGNTVVRGDGDAIQGIFMGSEVKLPYKNVVIDGNTVIGGMYNGILVGMAQGLTVTNNMVVGATGQTSWIRVNNADVVSGNTSQSFILDGVDVAAPKGNTLAKALSAGNMLVDAAKEAIRHSLSGNAPAEIIRGTDGADRLKAGKVGDYHLIGGEGNDTFYGGVGQTRMEGGNGNDYYYVNSDRDVVVEAKNGGEDTVYTSIDYTLADNVETLRLTDTDLTVQGNALNNRIVGTSGSDTMYGGDGDDSLQALGGENYLFGEGGNDTLSSEDGEDMLFGGAGDDRLTSGAGDDVLDGGDGNDVLEGGPGWDVLTGGAGADTFNYRPADIGERDIITDFSSKEGDIINLGLIDANSKTAKNDAFSFIGEGAFTKVAGQLHYVQVEGGIVVEGDLNGDAKADFSIFLQGVTHVTATDFVL